jgi:hypothetical protein
MVEGGGRASTGGVTGSTCCASLPARKSLRRVAVRRAGRRRGRDRRTPQRRRERTERGRERGFAERVWRRGGSGRPFPNPASPLLSGLSPDLGVLRVSPVGASGPMSVVAGLLKTLGFDWTWAGRPDRLRASARRHCQPDRPASAVAEPARAAKPGRGAAERREPPASPRDQPPFAWTGATALRTGLTAAGSTGSGSPDATPTIKRG